MAQFRAVIQGQRGQASRLGGKSSGIQAVVNGWNGGVKVLAHHSQREGHDGDVFAVFSTSGSNGGRAGQHLLSLDADGSLLWVNPILATAARLQEDPQQDDPHPEQTAAKAKLDAQRAPWR